MTCVLEGRFVVLVSASGTLCMTCVLEGRFVMLGATNRTLRIMRAR